MELMASKPEIEKYVGFIVNYAKRGACVITCLWTEEKPATLLVVSPYLSI